MDFYCESVFSGKVQVEKVLETENVLAFYHTKPAWTTHVVIVPKAHVLDFVEVDSGTLAEIMDVTKQSIKKLDLKDYKIVTNGGSFQDSKHLHFHLLSGEKK